METAIGVYASRDRAEQAVKDLIARNVPADSIVFLTRSESDATSFAKEVGGFAGGFLGGTVGMAAGAAAIALALVPGVGQVYALGVGATALFGYLGARGGSAAAKAIAHDESTPESGESPVRGCRHASRSAEAGPLGNCGTHRIPTSCGHRNQRPR